MEERFFRNLEECNAFVMETAMRGEVVNRRDRNYLT